MVRPVERVLVQCTACGQEVERTFRQVEKATSGRFFCSISCLRKIGPKPRTLPDHVCEICGTVFRPVSGTNPGRFCSRQCLTVWQARHSQTFTCEECGKPYLVKPSRIRLGKAIRFCSKKCQATAMTRHGLGRTYNGREVTANQQGYALIYEPTHPRANKSNGRVLEHRVVAERVLGRTLHSNEQVHHLNGIRSDNRPENLYVISPSEHTTVTLGESGMRRYGDQLRIRELEAKLAQYEKKFGPLT